MNRWKKVISLLALTALLATGCTTSTDAKASHKLKIVTTFYPMYDFAKHVAGDRADVTLLIPANVEPHDWEPTPQDLIKIQNADVFVYNGAGLEGWVDKTLQSLHRDNLKVVEASKGLPLLDGQEQEEHTDRSDEHPMDPHVWLDPVLAQQQVKVIQQALSDLDPANAAHYQDDAGSYIRQLQDVDNAYRDVTSNAPRKDFVTSHSAFGYLAKRYGLEQIPISGLNPDIEPTTTQVADVVKIARDRKTPVIYFESLVSPKIAEMVAQEIGCETAVLDPLEGLSEEEQAQHMDYVTVMERNLEALKKSLLIPPR
ncbi:zinc ABC transporter substrate-binding protein [Tumebacillus sp. ITR2]|uniref:Zinc ABC transporter substrate-binding protein n=1 Tax=Tumebacillus amylolyticus TaxID=2801339 RepID=A0ABS1JA16_9BACL|nr:metal ABC transporter substrate-binding protein [Tumebacillus amylolyticus]MBL0387113.1 zinc ABC transporter substrate-binding protein [Tumebacillus amylolyticus]